MTTKGTRMATFFEIVARVPLTGDAISNSRTVTRMSEAVEAFYKAVDAEGGTVATKIGRTAERTPKAVNAAILTLPREAAE